MKMFRVGILIPWVNTTMEDEIPILLHPDIGIHWSRMRPRILPRNGHDSSYMEMMIKDMPYALSKFDGLDLQTLVLGCTSASILETSKIIKIPKKYRNTRFISAFDSVIGQLTKLSAKNIMLFAPYDLKTIEAETYALKKAGFLVNKSVILDYDKEIRFIPSSKIIEIFLSEIIEGIDAVFFSCTALYTVSAFSELQSSHNVTIPLLSSNIAIAREINDQYTKSMLK